jgi:hypothetical protein
VGHPHYRHRHAHGHHLQPTSGETVALLRGIIGGLFHFVTVDCASNKWFFHLFNVFIYGSLPQDSRITIKYKIGLIHICACGCLWPVA